MYGSHLHLILHASCFILQIYSYCMATRGKVDTAVEKNGAGPLLWRHVECPSSFHQFVHKMENKNKTTAYSPSILHFKRKKLLRKHKNLDYI